MGLSAALEHIERFKGESLTRSLADIEVSIGGFDNAAIAKFCRSKRIDRSLIASATAIKRAAGQINVIIHAAGILCVLPYILRDSEVINSVSLGAGNTGRQFDLETNQRVPEFKFIDWQGGPESIRQNSIFKDFFSLAECQSEKEKYLYVVGMHYPDKFLRGRRALSSVLSKEHEIARQISEKYGETVKVVRDYFLLKEHEVRIRDVSRFIGRDA